jgi:hypothetical protein
MIKLSKMGRLQITAGILAFLLAGCLNPVTLVSPADSSKNTAQPSTAEKPDADPFTVDILVGDRSQNRSIAGPNSSKIKEAGLTGIRNFIQLIVMDDNGNIAAFDEVRKEGDSQNVAELWVMELALDKTYHFLLLMGHWDRDYAGGTDECYKYLENRVPTLLAAGLQSQKITGSGTVTINMYPLLMDMECMSEKGIFEPSVNAGNPGVISLFPVDWDVIWTIKRGSGGDGLADLIRAQKVLYPASDTLLLKNAPKTLVRRNTGPGTEEIIEEEATLCGNTITQSLGTYTSGFGKIGTDCSVNFKMEYTPFNLTGTGGNNPWTAFNEKSIFDLRGNNRPVWIIRNGINDRNQNSLTTFATGVKWNGIINGNGAVCFKMAAQTPAEGSTLLIKDGAFKGPSTSDKPDIAFTTEGYGGVAKAYYAVVASGGNVPDVQNYTLLDENIPAGKDHKRAIQLSANQVGADCNVYVILFKEGDVSDPLIINTATGSGSIDWTWG